MRRASRYFLLPALVPALAACNVYDPELAHCRPRTLGCLPDAPNVADTDPDAGGDQELLFALGNIQLRQTVLSGDQPWKSIGLNLDGINTTAASPRTECTTPDSSASVALDGVNGIDNVFGSSLWGSIASGGLSYLPNDICCWHDRGRGTILLHIEDWNGTRNDPAVTISLIVAADGTTAAPNTVMWDSATEHGLVLSASPSTAAPLPSWQPDTTYWYGSRSSFVLGDARLPVVVNKTAYIVDGVFVMKLDDTKTVDLFTGTGSVKMLLADAHLFGELSDDFTRITSGAVAGRMGYTDLLAVSSSIGQCTLDSNGNLTTIGEAVASTFKANADVFHDPTNPPPDGQCDAVSIGVSFIAVRGHWAGLAGETLCFPDACNPNATACPTLTADQNACASHPACVMH